MNKLNDKQLIIKDIGFTLLAEGRTLKLKAEGYSMYPTIKPGSLIYLEPVGDGNPPVPGEIVAWKRDKGFVVHRLIRIIKKDNDLQFITRGDSCSYEDNPVSPSLIAGRVSGIEDRYGNTISKGDLIRNHCYFYNRIAVWGLVQINRINRKVRKGRIAKNAK